LVANCFLGALAPVDFLAVYLVLAILNFENYINVIIFKLIELIIIDN